MNSQLRVVAHYFPQFHPRSPRTTRGGGKGFTDWDNVKRASRSSAGHDQPRVPRGPRLLRPVPRSRSRGRPSSRGARHRTLLPLPLLVRRQAAARTPTDICCSPTRTSTSRSASRGPNETWSRRWDGRDHHILISADAPADGRELGAPLRHPDQALARRARDSVSSTASRCS